MALLRAYKAIRPAMGFTVDEAPKTNDFTAELFASVKNDGRIGDATRLVLGGRAILEANFKLGLIFEDSGMENWSIVMEKWPRDMDIRRGLLTGLWQNITDVVASRDASVLDETGSEVPASRFLKRVKEAEEGPEVGSIRWAVMLNDCARLSIQLQGLPATAATLCGKPSLKRYNLTVSSPQVCLNSLVFLYKGHHNYCQFSQLL
jgi:hypothetical protein